MVIQIRTKLIPSYHQERQDLLGFEEVCLTADSLLLMMTVFVGRQGCPPGRSSVYHRSDYLLRSVSYRPLLEVMFLGKPTSRRSALNHGPRFIIYAK